MKLMFAGLTMLLLGLYLGGAFRQDNYEHRHSNAAGIEHYTFTSSMAPALPDNITSPESFAEIFIQLGIEQYIDDVSIDKKALQSFYWTLKNGYKIGVTTKDCKDGVRCLERIHISADERTQLQERADNNSNMRFISSADYALWPYTINYGLLKCTRPGAVSLWRKDKAWALNGLASAHMSYLRPQREILKPSAEMPGSFQNNAEILNDGLALCH